MNQEIFDIDLGARKVHVIKFQRPSAQGRHLHKTKDGNPINNSQAGRAATRWSIPDGKDRLNTGLWLRRTNPFYTGEGGEAKPLPSSVWVERGVQKMKYITWQEYFEIAHYKQPGHYRSDRIQWNELAANRKYQNSPLQAFRRTLIDGTNILDLSTQKDQLFYFFSLFNKKSFLQDKKDRRKYANAAFYIQEIGAPEKEQYESNKDADNAIANLLALEKKYSGEIVVQFGTILKVNTKRQSPSAAYNNLRNFIVGETKFGNRKTNCAVFNELYDILNRRGGRKRFDTMFFTQDLLDNRVIVFESGKYIWNSKRGTEEEVLGLSKEQVIASLLDADNAHIKQILTKELNDKTVR